MHKIAKGLKKKKKGKKSKQKEEELFKPEELEAYRKEHSTVAATTAATVAGTCGSGGTVEDTGKNEEWKNFLTLTSGVDDILKKTQDDLDRIKSTSFFQRIPPPTKPPVLKSKEQPSETNTHPANQDKVTVDNTANQKFEENPECEAKSLGIVEISESETDDEDDDDVFDTAYLDAIESGNIKLAYIPDSPTDNKQDDNDPFDTSIAERVILGPAVDKKGKKLVPIGAAVEVLTGRVQLPTCATRPVNKRQILKEKNLLLESFDSGEPPIVTASSKNDTPEKVKTLLDDDEIPLPKEPIDLSKSLYIPPPPPPVTENQIQPEIEDEADKEFEALATESFVKSHSNLITEVQLNQLEGNTVVAALDSTDWKAFDTDKNSKEFTTECADEELDPFDTTFVVNFVSANQQTDKNLNSTAKPNNVQTSLESQPKLSAPIQRDLLGGSTSDLSNLGDQPIQPRNEESTLNEIKYCDPFDTSQVDSLKAPGQTELKFLEKELLGDLNPTVAPPPPPAATAVKQVESFDDDDFDPRALEDRKTQGRSLSRPDVLNVSAQSKSVSFVVPKTQEDLLGLDDVSRYVKPLTPFYVRKNSIPGLENPIKDEEDEEIEEDPFDTSFVTSLKPGKAELKVIETELFQSNPLLEDPDFDPRDNAKLDKVTKVEAIKEIINPKKTQILTEKKQSIDLLAEANDIAAKVLTPATEISTDSFSYDDPFDTSIATNILPGKTELKLLENELNSI